MNLEGFQVILNFFHHNHMLQTILNLLICISKMIKKHLIFCRCPPKKWFLSQGGGSKDMDISATIRFFLFLGLTLVCRSKCTYVQQGDGLSSIVRFSNLMKKYDTVFVQCTVYCVQSVYELFNVNCSTCFLYCIYLVFEVSWLPCLEIPIVPIILNSTPN